MNPEYVAYLKSLAWMEKRELALERACRCCEFCGHDGKPLHAHHLTYARLGNELPDDLCVLCNDCHTDLHDYPKLRADIEGLVRRRREEEVLV